MRYLLLIILGLAIGAVIAAVTEARMAHLRQVAPWAVPAWTAGFTDPSGLRRGTAQNLLIDGVPGATTLNWRFRRLGTDGADWAVDWQAPGLTGRGDLRLGFSPGNARLWDGAAELSLDDLPALIDGRTTGGIIAVKGLDVRFDPTRGTVQAASGQAEWQGARIDGRAIGKGQISLVSGQGGGWRAPFAVTGDVVEVSGSLEGRFGVSIAQLEIMIRNAGSMPEEWQRLLGQKVRQDDAGTWTIRREVDLAGPWPVF